MGRPYVKCNPSRTETPSIFGETELLTECGVLWCSSRACYPAITLQWMVDDDPAWRLSNLSKMDRTSSPWMMGTTSLVSLSSIIQGCPLDNWAAKYCCLSIASRCRDSSLFCLTPGVFSCPHIDTLDAQIVLNFSFLALTPLSNSNCLFSCTVLGVQASFYCFIVLQTVPRW